MSPPAATADGAPGLGGRPGRFRVRHLVHRRTLCYSLGMAMSTPAPFTPATAAGIRWTDTNGRTCGFPAARPGYGIRNAAGQWLGLVRGSAAPTAPALWSRKATAAEVAESLAPHVDDLAAALPRGFVWFEEVR